MVDVVLDVKTPSDFAFGFVRVRSIEYKLIVVCSCCKMVRRINVKMKTCQIYSFFVFYDDLIERHIRLIFIHTKVSKNMLFNRNVIFFTIDILVRSK